LKLFFFRCFQDFFIMPDSPGTFSFIIGYWVKSSIDIISDSNATTTSRLAAAASLAGAGAAFYYVAGNPVELVQQADFLTLGIGYGAATLTGYAVSRLGNSLAN